MRFIFGIKNGYKKNNPSVDYVDSSPYTGEPFYVGALLNFPTGKPFYVGALLTFPRGAFFELQASLVGSCYATPRVVTRRAGSEGLYLQ